MDTKTVTNHITGKDISGIFDGPYVLYKNDQVFVKYIVYDETNGTKSVHADSVALSEKKDILLKVNTDLPGKTFSVQLKKKLQTEKCEYKKPARQFVLSDIEGNFKAFRKLLQANGVVDSNLNWAFGNGHLVLIGDFFDRGTQVTEVLWLIYSLEEKAKDAGGYVHYILGNHEIMNMNGDLRYLQPKYLEDAQLLNEQYVSLYNENSELGRWLRTKNIMERIGGFLYIHGGISSLINSMGTSISDINELARPYYSDTSFKYPDPRIDVIYSDEGPFWYRGYYSGNAKASTAQIDSTISEFHVDRIVTGHTIVAETISVWHNGKVINTDVHHAGGKSEALLIEGDKRYRVDGEGHKILL